MEAREIGLLLRELVSEYRDRNGGKAPAQIYASADVLASLEAEKDPLLALKRTVAGYSFDGVAIEPKPRQSLPFLLRP
jgi:hypothetical protein